MVGADLVTNVGTYTGRFVGSIATFRLCSWMRRTNRGKKKITNGPHRPSFTLVAEIDAPTWPILGQKKVELGHALVPGCKINTL
jgi:hypothetical protein